MTNLQQELEKHLKLGVTMTQVSSPQALEAIIATQQTLLQELQTETIMLRAQLAIAQQLVSAAQVDKPAENIDP